MSGPWLSVVGIGEDGLDGLTSAARAALDGAEVVIGGERHLSMVDVTGRQGVVWESPLSRTVQRIKEFRGRRVCVLASGDPMHFGVGTRLCRMFPMEELTILPNVSCFSLAAARLGWSLADLTIVPVHGRPLALLNRHLAPDARLISLTVDGDTPNQIARLLVDAGYGDSAMSVFEYLGGRREARFDSPARDWDRRVGGLNLVAIDCRTDRLPVPATGLEDDLFGHDGQLTKREVRAVTMAALTPFPGALLWDVGCGNGSIAIEWLRQCTTARAIGLDRSAARLDNARANAARLGVPGLDTRQGEALDLLDDLPDPDAVFVGGGVGDTALLARCWDRLKPGGVLAANAVTVEGEAALLDHAARHGGDLVRIAVSRLESLGDAHAWTDRRPVVHYRGRKS